MSIKSNPGYQYAYGRSPLYCLIDESVVDLTSTGEWLDMDGDLSAPEFLPTGSTNGRIKNGAGVAKDFVSRAISLEETANDELISQLIDELLAELD